MPDPPSPPIVLWDIDGTLVRGKGGRVSVNAFIRALQQASRLEAQLVYPTGVAGMTDRGIALDTLAAASLGEAEATAILEEFGPAYLVELERTREALHQDLLVLPGVREILPRLQQLGIVQTVLTGNLKPIAQLKLALVELDQYLDFDVGAFGSDHHDRNCLVPIVRERVQQKFGYLAEPRDMVVVGDTPRDIACARAGGARVVAVATGNSSRVELVSHAPDALLDDLQETDAVVQTLLRYSTYSDSDAADPALIV
jgi:phosphoglycolate phosphatase